MVEIVNKKKRQKSVNKMAKKDAKRYVDAKMYYGEGAGTRRKLLKGELNKKFKDQEYKKAFDDYVNNADYGKSVNRAKRERKARDTAHNVKRVAKKYAIPVAMFGGGLYYATHKEQIDKMVVSFMDNAVKKAGNSYQRHKTKQFLKRAGVR